MSYFYPLDGTRINLAVSAAPMIANNWLGFVTPQVDLREYFKITGLLSLASRITGAASFGPTPQNFFIGGVDSWINPTYQTQGIPITSPQDFAFFTPGLPLRGFPYYAEIGTHYPDRKSGSALSVSHSYRRISHCVFWRHVRRCRGRMGPHRSISFRRMWRPAIGKPVIAALDRDRHSYLPVRILYSLRYGLDDEHRDVVHSELYYFARRGFLAVNSLGK